MASKRIFPVHLDAREREILSREADRLGVSMAEVVRRQIRRMGGIIVDDLDASPPPPLRRVPSF
jgi:hypothetical protein